MCELREASQCACFVPGALSAFRPESPDGHHDVGAQLSSGYGLWLHRDSGAARILYHGRLGRHATRHISCLNGLYSVTRKKKLLFVKAYEPACIAF